MLQPKVETRIATAIRNAAGSSEHLLHHGGRYAVFGGVLDAAREHGRPLRIADERQRKQVNEVRRNVEQDHDAGADRQRQRQVALRILHLTGREGDVVPGVGRE